MILLGFINLLAFTNLSQLIGNVAGGLPADAVLGLSVLCFILIVEGWIWFTRLQVSSQYRSMSHLTLKYDLRLKSLPTKEDS